MDISQFSPITPTPILDGLYLLLNTGEIISQHKKNPGKILSKRIDRAGYYSVRLTQAGKTKTFLLHRLLAQCFIPNPENKPCVNHINGNKLDFSLSNLEWSTQSENTVHAYKHGLCYAAECTSKKVIDICTGKEYTSVKLAAKAAGLPYSTCKNYLNGRRKNPTCLQVIRSLAQSA